MSGGAAICDRSHQPRGAWIRENRTTRRFHTARVTSTHKPDAGGDPYRGIGPKADANSTLRCIGGHSREVPGRGSCTAARRVYGCRPASSGRINIIYLFKPAWASVLTSAIGSPRHRRLGKRPIRSRLSAQWPLRIGSLARPPSVQTPLAAPGPLDRLP
jgi:hypothetical protein